MIIGVGGSNVAVERCHFVPIGGSSRHKADCRQPTDDDRSRYSHLCPFSLPTPPADSSPRPRPKRDAAVAAEPSRAHGEAKNPESQNPFILLLRSVHRNDRGRKD